MTKAYKPKYKTFADYLAAKGEEPAEEVELIYERHNLSFDRVIRCMRLGLAKIAADCVERDLGIRDPKGKRRTIDPASLQFIPAKYHVTYELIEAPE
jgi:hypothetical protein